MKTAFKIVGIVGGTIGVFGIIFYSIIFSTALDMCNNTMANKIESPQRKWNIAVFKRNCGATTDFSTQISILRQNQKLGNEPGNIFSASRGHGKAKLDQHGLIYVDPQWINSQTILIKFDSMAIVYERKKSFNGIIIKYQKVSREK